MKKFPIKIDLSTFFEDERKFVIILVDPQWKSVECLQHRVEEIFDVKPVRFLTTDNLFIPQQESIEVLEFTESIKAFIPKHVLEESRRRSKQYQEEKTKIQQYDLNTELLPIGEAPIKKRKYHSLGTDHLGSSTPNQSKKSKRTPVLIQPISNESYEITSTNDQAIIVKGCSLDKSSIGNLTISDKTENESEPTGDKPSRKRKRRVPKEKSERNKNTDQEENKTVDSITVRSEIPSSTFLNNSKSAENNSHVYFEDSTIVESTTVKHKTKFDDKAAREETISLNVIFKCKLNEIEFGEPLIHPLQKINKELNTRKPVINIQENIIIRPADMDISTKYPPTESIENEIVEEGMNNIENSVVNSPNREEVSTIIENDQSDVVTTKIPEDRKSEIEVENVSQIENLMEKNNLVNTVNENENHTEKDLIESNANQSKIQLTTNECILSEEEAANPIGEKIKPKTPLKKCSNISDISEISMAMDGSSVIDLDDDEDVIDLSDVEDQQQLRANLNTMSSNSLNKSIHSMSIKEMLPFCTQLVDLPDLEDIVIFKFNRRAVGEKPDLSEFIACRCEHINKRTKVLKLAVIDATLENDILPQKYCYNLDESFENRFMNIKLADMIEPKVLKA